jgi:hypothetical protein
VEESLRESDRRRIEVALYERIGLEQRAAAALTEVSLYTTLMNRAESR